MEILKETWHETRNELAAGNNRLYKNSTSGFN